ncbi:MULTISPECIES: hypothetical protein [unclassified Aeromicrobium]|uniref:hypothetical protein n=1 Tax=unclassified Aeromicrobium TaxID=2633570 RepID=UPI00288B632A|nr:MULTISPECIES: hypothetical protein [unclassified Aeromicrobium]
MSNASAARPATTRHGWLLLVLAPALIVGIVLMHSLMSAPAIGGMSAMDDSMTSMAMTHPAAATHAAVSPTGADAPMGHGTGGMPDCGGLMIMCLALLVSALALAAWRRGPSTRVLWQQARPTLVHLGSMRGTFEALTPRQRTTVIRC